MGIADEVDAAALHGQLSAIRQWIRDRWPGARALVESPLMLVRPNGQHVVGRSDLLLDTGDGWILLDHKSAPGGSAQWDAMATAHGGQLFAYKEAIETITERPVKEAWLVLPVAGTGLRLALHGVG